MNKNSFSAKKTVYELTVPKGTGKAIARRLETITVVKTEDSDIIYFVEHPESVGRRLQNVRSRNEYTCTPVPIPPMQESA